MVNDTPRGVSLTIYMVNDFGHGSDTARTRLRHGSIIVMGRGDGRRWIWFQASTEGRREKGEEGKMSRVLGEGGESRGGGWVGVAGESEGGGWVGGGDRGEHEEVGS